MRRDFGLKEIDVFVRVVELGSFKEAAQALNLTQSALTQRLKKLEAALGAKLIDRTTRSLAPTAIGRDFLPAARGLLSQFERTVDGVEDRVAGRAGRVSIASLISVATYVLPQAIRRFGEAHPDVRVQVFDAAEREIADHVRRGDAEFAVDMQTGAAAADLEVTPMMRDHFVLVCRGDHPAAVGGPVAWQDLAELPVIMLGARSGTSRLVLDSLPAARRAAAWRHEVQHLSTMLGFVEAGLGVGIVPGLVMPAIAARGLVHRPLTTPGLERTLVLLQRRDATLSPAAERLKALLLDAFGALRSAA